MNILEEISELKEQLSESSLAQIENGKWDEALNLSASYQEDINIIKIYLRSMTLDTNIWSTVGWDKIQPIEDLLSKIFQQLGLSESSNPFIKFINIFLSISENKLTKDNIIFLNNLYASSVIDFGDIAGIGPDKTSHIIFNSYLYTLSNSDAEFMVKAYEWLSIEYNLTKLNFLSLTHVGNVNIPDNYKKLSKYSKGVSTINVNEIRNTVIFISKSNFKKSRLHTPQEVENFLTITSQTSKQGSHKSSAVLNAQKTLNSLTSDEKKEFLNNLVQNSNYAEILKKLINA